MADWSNVGLIFTGPARVAGSVGERPNWKIPVLVLVLLSAIFTYALHSSPYYLQYQREMVERFARDGGREIDTDALTRQTAGKTAAGLVGAVVMTVLFTLVGAAVLNGVAMLLGGTAGFARMFSFFAYAMIIVGAGNLLRIPLIAAKKSMDVRLSLAAFAPGVRLESPMGVLLGSTDIFALWCLVASAIGFSALTGLGSKKSAVVLVALYAILIALQVGASALTAKALS
jgi:hypothetical protein